MSTSDSERPGPSARNSFLDSSWTGQRKGVILPLVAAAIALWLVFLADMSYLFGATLDQRHRVHALNVLVVDFDGGAVAEAVSGTYSFMQGNDFPTLEFQDASPRYPDPAAVKEAVCSGDYWGAVYTRSGASAQLADALSGAPGAANYAANNTVTYIYNQARYTTLADGAIGATLRALIAASRDAYYQTDDGREALANLDRTNPSAVQAFLNPIQPSADIIMPTQQGSRAFYNTLNVVFPILLVFFFSLVVNGLSQSNGLLVRLRRGDLWLMRLVASKAYGLIAALMVTAYIWAFREDWPVASHVFVTNWMIVWFQIDINWQVFDAVIASYLPMAATPFFVMTWIVVNVASTAFPFEVSAGFYRVGYAFPGHHIYALQVQAWSGCASQLRTALPVLFSWWLLGHVAVVFSIRKRCADADKVAAQNSQKVLQPQSEMASAGSDVTTKAD
ncbi:hypothetical protein S40293_09838 [Stachybotrys chartarum IBT 40293]|nr:hypothetical protein S40293_09838 [Stachybotrys chartarum IBT 40293]